MINLFFFLSFLFQKTKIWEIFFFHFFARFVIIIYKLHWVFLIKRKWSIRKKLIGFLRKVKFCRLIIWQLNGVYLTAKVLAFPESAAKLWNFHGKCVKFLWLIFEYATFPCFIAIIQPKMIAFCLKGCWIMAVELQLKIDKKS